MIHMRGDMMKKPEIPPNICSGIAPHFQISSIWIFGSATRENFTEESDIDLVVDFKHETRTTLLTLALLQTDLEKAFGRKVDLITLKAIDDFMNPILKQEVLSTMVKIYGP